MFWFDLVCVGFAKPNTPSAIDYDAADDDYNYTDEEENKPDSSDRYGVKDNTSSSILPPPYFQTPEYTKTVKNGDSVELECDVKNFDCKLFRPTTKCQFISYVSITISLFLPQIQRSPTSSCGTTSPR